MLKLKISYVCKASHDSGNVKWIFPVPVREEDTSSQTGKCHVRAAYASIISFYISLSCLARLDLFFFKSIYYKWGRSREKCERHSPTPRKGLLTFNSTNNLWKSPEM